MTIHRFRYSIYNIRPLATSVEETLGKAAVRTNMNRIHRKGKGTLSAFTMLCFSVACTHLKNNSLSFHSLSQWLHSTVSHSSALESLYTRCLCSTQHKSPVLLRWGLARGCTHTKGGRKEKTERKSEVEWKQRVVFVISNNESITENGTTKVYRDQS